ncbi:MAG TPA: alpha/beta fold hydrolase [Vicinamibacterales bacterium]|nr:alpha/beta fold hydrolase [Vicinamibacterales bacterium]
MRGLALVLSILLAMCLVTVRADEQLTLTSGDARLAATLRLPAAGSRPVPAVIILHGSGRVTAADLMGGPGRRLADMGLAVLAYDKRGVGQSTGDYSTINAANSVAMFNLLAGDALAAVAVLGARPEIDARRIGLVGISQGGWIAPLAASRTTRVAFVVTVSAPAVSVGEEIAYSRLAGEDPGSITGLSDEEIDRRMCAFTGPHGYDPVPTLEALRVPSFWVLGEKDRSIPLRKTVVTLSRLAADRGRPIATHVIPDVNHSLRHAETGRQPDFWRAIGDWLRANRFVD